MRSSAVSKAEIIETIVYKLAPFVLKHPYFGPLGSVPKITHKLCAFSQHPAWR